MVFSAEFLAPTAPGRRVTEMVSKWAARRDWAVPPTLQTVIPQAPPRIQSVQRTSAYHLAVVFDQAMRLDEILAHQRPLRFRRDGRDELAFNGEAGGLVLQSETHFGCESGQVECAWC